MPTSARTEPIGSSGVTWLSRDFGEKRATATAATATSGRLTRMAEPHQNSSSSAPATTGPMAAPAPANPAQVAMARVRSSGGNTAVMSDSVAGITNAEPTPMIPRPTMTWPGAVASPATSSPTANTPRPPRRAPLRPNRSPSAPAVSSRPANTRAYESMIQWSWVAVAPRSCWRRGRRHVEGRDGHHHEDEGQAHDPEEEPPPTVDVGIFEQLGAGVVETHDVKRIRSVIERHRFVL